MWEFRVHTFSRSDPFLLLLLRRHPSDVREHRTEQRQVISFTKMILLLLLLLSFGNIVSVPFISTTNVRYMCSCRLTLPFIHRFIRALVVPIHTLPSARFVQRAMRVSFVCEARPQSRYSQFTVQSFEEEVSRTHAHTPYNNERPYHISLMHESKMRVLCECVCTHIG